MATPFVLLEVLGPRMSLDAWLVVLQDHGGCHLGDALEGLDGEPGIGRPLTTPAEWDGRARRGAAARALRAVEAVLPASASTEDPRMRPTWSVGARGEGLEDLERIVTESEAVAARIRHDLEALRRAERARTARAADQLALRALGALEVPKVGGAAWAVASEGGVAARLRKQLKVAGLDCAVAEGSTPGGRSQSVVVACGALEGEIARSALAAANATGGAFDLPDALCEKDLPAAREVAAEALRDATAAFDRAGAALRERLGVDGPRARVLLDALEDAEARAAARESLASTDHVTAARVFVRREDEASLRRQLSLAFGDELVVRALPKSTDAPALPRAVAGLPFAALRGLVPARFGEVATPSLLALALPMLVGAAVADVGVGLLLLFTGALVGIGAPPSSPRRDTSLLAELGGLVALVFGVVEGRAFGAAGEAWLGTGWGLFPEATFLEALGPGRGVIVRVGGVALLLFLWGLVCVAANLRRRRRTRVLSAALGALSPLAVAGLAALALPDGGWRWGWLAFPVAVLGTFLLAGLRLGLGRLVLDLVGVVRLVAVALAALLLFREGFAALVEPDVTALVMGPVLLVLAALALTIDPAHVAMGVPYDLSLGSASLTQPFTPLARRVVRKATGGAE